VKRALLYGGCIGVAYILRFAHDYPNVVAGAVGQDPVGFAEGVNSRATFFAMMEPTIALAKEKGMQAVVDAAIANPLFVMNNGAGPFAARIHDDEAFRAEVLALTPAAYEKLLIDYDNQLWGRHIPFCSV
jgi:hypothetical protein